MCTICILYLSARYFEYNRSLSQCLHFLFKRTQVSVSAWDGMFSPVLRLLRRTFWLLFGVLTALLCDIHALPLSLPFSRKKVSRQNLDVLIVGAGISGIAIAKVVTHRNKKRYWQSCLETEGYRGVSLQDSGARTPVGRDLVLEQVPGSGLRRLRWRLQFLLEP